MSFRDCRVVCEVFTSRTEHPGASSDAGAVSAGTRADGTLGPTCCWSAARRGFAKGTLDEHASREGLLASDSANCQSASVCCFELLRRLGTTHRPTARSMTTRCCRNRPVRWFSVFFFRRVIRFTSRAGFRGICRVAGRVFEPVLWLHTNESERCSKIGPPRSRTSCAPCHWPQRHASRQFSAECRGYDAAAHINLTESGNPAYIEQPAAKLVSGNGKYLQTIRRTLRGVGKARREPKWPATANCVTKGV
jgi:hypothetical protein